MAGFWRRFVRGNTRTVTAVVTVPDRWGVQAASLGMVTSTYSPASTGLHNPRRPGAAGFGGDRGYGVNRWAGAGLPDQPVQVFTGAARPVQDPRSQRLGLGAGVSGQPGLPSTGMQGGPGLGYPMAMGLGG